MTDRNDRQLQTQGPNDCKDQTKGPGWGWGFLSLYLLCVCKVQFHFTNEQMTEVAEVCTAEVQEPTSLTVY